MDLKELTDLYELYIMYRYVEQKKKRQKKKEWIHQINKQRQEWGAYACLMPQLKSDDRKFFNFCRMSQICFQDLLVQIHDDIKKSDTAFRQAIEPELKLMLALRFLATGASFQSLHYQFRVGNTTAREAVYDVCEAIWRRPGPIEIPNQTSDSLREIASQFLTLWQYPNCIGAIDGKHIVIKCPDNSLGEYYNYKGTFPIHLQAVSDADGYFTYVDVGDYGRHCDAGVLKYSSFGKALTTNKLPIPDDEAIFSSEPLPFVFIGDEAYPLTRHLMKPYARRDLDNTKRIYNYRHSRARRVVECAFGIMSTKWRALQTALYMSPEHAKLVALACCVLHDYVRRREGTEYAADFSFEDEIAVQDTPRDQYGRPSDIVLHVRDTFATIMEQSIPLPWQDQSAHIQ